MISMVLLAISCLGQSHDALLHLGEHGHFQLVKEYVTRYQFSPPPSDLRVYYIWVPNASDPVYVPPDTYTPKHVTFVHSSSKNNDVFVLTRKAIKGEVTVDNKPLDGYVLEGTEYLKSPNGFLVPLEKFTLDDILSHDKVDKKVINGKFIWIAIGNWPMLVRYDSELYKAVRERKQ